jgi:hypothetical protein
MISFRSIQKFADNPDEIQSYLSPEDRELEQIGKDAKKLIELARASIGASDEEVARIIEEIKKIGERNS